MSFSDQNLTDESTPGHDTAPLAIYEGLEKKIGKYRHRNVDVLKFAHHVWGLDVEAGERLLAMPITLDESDVTAYRRCTQEDDLHAPFLMFSKALIMAAVKELFDGVDDAADQAI